MEKEYVDWQMAVFQFRVKSFIEKNAAGKNKIVKDKGKINYFVFPLVILWKKSK